MIGDAPRPDAELVARMVGGDMEAFEELYRQHARRLFNLAHRMLGDTADAEDMLQEIFLQAFRKLHGFKGESSIGTWLYRLGMNLCLDRVRSRAAKDGRQTDSLDADDRPPVADTAVTGDLVVSRLDLERAIATLPEGCRAAFLLHDVEGFDHREVGEILGISEGTSKSQVHKARLRLRGWLRGRPALAVARTK